MKTALFIGLLVASGTSARQALSDEHYWCTDAQREVTKCSKKLDPVLGQWNDGTTQRFDNECEACINPAVDSYYRVTKCTEALIAKESDNSSTIGVCAVNSDGYLQDYRDEYYACDANMESFFKGHCPRKLDITIAYCPLNPKPKFRCYSLSNPVCVTTVDGSQRTALNPCSACTTEDAVYYSAGSCEGESEEELPSFPKPIFRLPTNVPTTTTDDTAPVETEEVSSPVAQALLQKKGKKV